MKKKLLFVLTSMNIGGVEKSFLSLLSVLPKEKYDVTVLLLEKRGGFVNYLPYWVKVREADWFKKVKPIIMQPPQDIIHFYYRNHKWFKIPTFVTTYFASKYFNNRFSYYQYVLHDVLNDPEIYDVAIAYQGPTDIIDFYVANKVTAKKKISWVHFDVSKHYINQKLYTRLYSKFSEVYVVSKLALEKLVEVIPSVKGKVQVKENIISPQMINEMAQNPVNFAPDFKGTKIVTVGRLSEEKGQDIAIKTLHRLRNEGYDVRWYCVGEGKARQKYEELIMYYGLQNDFLLLGAMPNPYPYIKEADIYVQPSRHESYCLTLAEAKILKKPIITTGFLGAYEQLQDGIDGFIAKNEKDLLIKIKLVLDNPKKYGDLLSS